MKGKELDSLGLNEQTQISAIASSEIDLCNWSYEWIE